MATATTSRERLPIKLILPDQGKEKPVQGGGGPKVPFRPVNAAYRRQLGNQVDTLRTALSAPLAKGPVPIRVRLLAKASAKSHRPNTLFSDSTCPVMGAGALGELFCKATPQGLSKLQRLISEGDSDQLVKELSTIETIEAVTPSYRRRGLSAVDVLKGSPRRGQGFTTRVRLFDFGDDSEQRRLVKQFEETCAQRQLAVSRTGYSSSSYLFGVECRTADDVDALSKVVGVRSIGRMPLIRTLRPRMFNAKPLPQLLRRADVIGDVPVVAVVDTGISDALPALRDWTVGRMSFVAPKYRNAEHGSFVAGLICWGGALNPTLPGLDSNPCAVFDVSVIPNYDPANGPTDALQEQEFLYSLEQALIAHANEYRVWNLSLGTDAVCSLDEFSAFAEELDNLQERFKVSFVLSAGNVETLPLLNYPRTGAELDSGRITAPADSVLGICVGSVSHVAYADGKGPKMHEPSSFSRHGAGPNHVIKPDLVHYGGSCTRDSSHVTGIRSISETGTAENVGTSFATPLVSRTLAQIYHHITPAPSPVLARALLTHHARDPRSGTRVPDGEENYFGFGVPAAVPYCLECTPHTSTLIFDDVLRPGFFLEWDNFPYPASLYRNGRFFGEISMTVAFAPTRGARWGTEYCETHIDAHFGVYRRTLSRTTGELSKPKFHGLVPPEHKNPGQLYESYQIEKLRKWAPVRTYYGDMGKNGQAGDRWRLMVQLLSRHGVDKGKMAQPFALIITIRDPKGKAPVYDEMARAVRNRFSSQNLAVRAAAQIRGRR